MLNKMTLIGRLGSDPETRTTASGQSVTNFSVATNYSYKNAAGEKIKETTWHRLVLFGGLSDIAQTYLRKGDCAYFEGRIQNRTYEDKTGQTRNVTEVVVNELKLLPTQGESTSTSAPSTPAPSAKRTAAKARTVEVDDSDSPF